MRRMGRGMSFALLLGALAVAPAVAVAQRAPGAAGQGGQAQRAQMEQQLRRSLWRITQQRIGLTDAQMLQLGQESSRFDERRRALVQEERVQRRRCGASCAPIPRPTRRKWPRRSTGCMRCNASASSCRWRSSAPSRSS